MTIERRVKPRPVSIETRSDGKKTISGYAAVFYDSSNQDTEYEMWEGCVERIAPGAFNRAIAEGQDVLCTFNHDGGLLMGRTANKTCRLSVDSVGLKYEADLPETSSAHDCAELVSRGDVSGSSFSFMTKGVQWTTEGEYEVRTLIDVDLMDVGPVTSPAYKATTTAARDEKSSLDAEKAELLKKKQREADAVNVVVTRIRLDV